MLWILISLLYFRMGHLKANQELYLEGNQGGREKSVERRMI